MGKLKRSKDAREDLLEIGEFIGADDPAAAARLLERFEQVFHRLARRPRLGRARDDIAPGLRSITEGTYLIFYRLRTGGIEIVRVLSGYRDLPRLFRK